MIKTKSMKWKKGEMTCVGTQQIPRNTVLNLQKINHLMSIYWVKTMHIGKQMKKHVLW